MRFAAALVDYFRGEPRPVPRGGRAGRLRGDWGGTSSGAGFSDLLNYCAAVGDGVWALKDRTGRPTGPLLGGFVYEGPDLECASAHDVMRGRALTNAALRDLDSQWIIHIDAIVRTEHRPHGEGCDGAVNALIDEEFQRNAHYFITRYHIFLTKREDLFSAPAAKKVARFIEGESQHETQDDLEAAVEAFERDMQRVHDGLAAVMPAVARLRVRDRNDELLQAVNFAVNGSWHKCVPLNKPVHLDAILARQLSWNTEGQFSYDEDEIACVSVLLPAQTEPLVLSTLCTLGLELRWSTRFLPFDYLKSMSALQELEKRWMQKNDADGQKRLAEVTAAKTLLEEKQIRFGHYVSVVVLRERVSDPEDGAARARARKRVLENARTVLHALKQSGVPALLEQGRNKLEAFLGTLPGHGVENVRKPLIHTVHLADLMPMATEWPGEPFNPCDKYTQFYDAPAPALMRVRTTSGSWFDLNLHQGDVGHTLILGPTGNGKTTLLNTIATQFRRYRGGQVFAFDFRRGMLPLTLAQDDGAHYDLGAGTGPSLCPLADIDTPEDRAWAESWIVGLCKHRNQIVSNEGMAAIKRALEKMAAGTRGPSERTLLDFYNYLQDPELSPAVAHYLSGAAGRILNGSSNAIRFSSFTTFETEGLKNCGDDVRFLALLYLFRQVEKRLDGRPTLLVLDEAWNALKHYEEQLAEWLVSLRTKNCAVVMATQSLSQILKSGIASIIFESCPTRLLLPNPTARAKSVKEVYQQHLGLSEAQAELLAHIQPKRWYMYTNAAGSKARLFTLGLGPIALSFVGATSPQDLQEIAGLYREDPATWKVRWLQRRSLGDAAQRLEALALEQRSAA